MATKKRSKKKQVIDPRRIYVLVPETVQVPQGRGGKKKITKRMEAGRLMAQVGHVVTKMRTQDFILQEFGREPITTITLAVRNSQELEKLIEELTGVMPVWRFEDENPGFYGTRRSVLTAVCTGPVLRDEVEDCLGYLELYKARGE